MPIYEYSCKNCGYATEVIQKFSDSPLSDCPNCGKPDFVKQISTPAFHLKGGGWYVTDFKDKPKTAKPAETKTDVAADKTVADKPKDTSA